MSSNTTYYYRAFAQTSVEVTYGDIQSFETLVASVPEVSIDSVGQVKGDSVRISATVSDDGGATVESRGICWSTDPDPDLSDHNLVMGSGTGSFICTINNLERATTFHMRAYATNSSGTAYSDPSTFKTPAGIPTVITSQISDITENSARSGGNVTDDGGAEVTSRGICWSTSEDPAVDDTRTIDGTGTGEFISYLADLTCSTTYYVRAYAINSAGISYGEQLSFTTSDCPETLPTVVTTTMSNITETTARSGGNVTDSGSAQVTSRGVCWSISQNPTTSDIKTSDGTGTGSYASMLTGLECNTTYYVRAYATNEVGTAYGDEENFTTSDCPVFLPEVSTSEISNITERSAMCGGNVTSDGGAEVIDRGICWSTDPDPTTTNTRTTDGSGTGSYTSMLTGLECGTTYYVRAYAINEVGTTYGNEVSFQTSACPVFLPELTTSSISNITESSAMCGGNVTSDGGADVINRGICWNTAPNPTTGDSKTSDGTGTGSYTSSLSDLDAGTTYHVRAYAINAAGTSYGNEVSFNTLDLPTVTTSSVSIIMENSAGSGGNVVDDGGSPVTARGVCWSTDPNPTTTNTRTSDGNGTGSYTSTLTGLSPQTQYFMRAYATNQVGTAYGGELSFTTDKPDITGQTGTLSDYDGNTYGWIGIGKQAWMSENLKTTHYSDGTSIPYVEDNDQWDNLGTQGKAYCWYDHQSTNRDIYGGLYTWAGAMNRAGSSDSNPSGIQGACPDGWHLPSDSEWKQLEIFLGMSPTEANNTGYRGSDEGGKLKETGTSPWWGPNSGATNESGFSALPGGNRFVGWYFDYLGELAVFWSASHKSTETATAWYRALKYDTAKMNRYNGYKFYGQSVRCVKD